MPVVGRVSKIGTGRQKMKDTMAGYWISVLWENSGKLCKIQASHCPTRGTIELWSLSTKSPSLVEDIPRGQFLLLLAYHMGLMEQPPEPLEKASGRYQQTLSPEIGF